MLAEEDDSSLQGSSAEAQALLAAVLQAFRQGMPDREAFLAEAQQAAGGVSSSSSSSSSSAEARSERSEQQQWSAQDVLTAITVGAWTPESSAAAAAAASSGPAGGYWVLDPIDGTKGFLRGGQYAVGLAYVSAAGQLELSAIACPWLPYPAWGSAGGGCDSPAGPVGCLFAAARGCGATMEPLWPAAGSAAGSSAVRSISTAAADAAGSLTLCESFESGHSNHSASAALAQALGLSGSPIRIDSMCKYGLLARGCGQLYIRLPIAGYAEKVWDHAPGALLLQEAGGSVSDAAGRPLDFSKGRLLSENHGIIGACSEQLRLRAVAALQQQQQQQQGLK
jgi:HAL2 family 3'(2'),5'-bisphosphate nucleotidase